MALKDNETGERLAGYMRVCCERDLRGLLRLNFPLKPFGQNGREVPFRFKHTQTAIMGLVITNLKIVII